MYTHNMNPLKPRAEKLRDNGYSYKMISEKLGIAPSTLSLWFRDRAYTPNREVISRIKNGPRKAAQKRHDLKIEQIQTIRKKSFAEIGQITKRDLWMLGIGIYIGEGSKSIESVRIMNSDPAVIKFSIRWLKEACGLDEENIMISLFLYPDNNIEKSIKYWQETTGLSTSNFRKTHVDVRDNKRKAAKGKLPYGTVQLRINANGDKSRGVALFRQISGWIDCVLDTV